MCLDISIHMEEVTYTYGGFLKWGYPIAGWFIREHSNLKWDDDWGYPWLGNLHDYEVAGLKSVRGWPIDSDCKILTKSLKPPNPVVSGLQKFLSKYPIDKFPYDIPHDILGISHMFPQKNSTSQHNQPCLTQVLVIPDLPNETSASWVQNVTKKRVSSGMMCSIDVFMEIWCIEKHTNTWQLHKIHDNYTKKWTNQYITKHTSTK